MRSLTEPASPMRVLMRIPDLSPGPAPAMPASPVETFVQQPLAPLAPLASAPPPAPPKPQHHAEKHGVTPDELKTSRRFARPLTVLAILAVAAVVGVTLSKRAQQGSPPPTPDQVASGADQAVPGGTPTEITQIPEISFPPVPPVPPAPAAPAVSAAPAVPGPTETMKIERLPSVEDKTSTAQAVQDGATARVSDSAAPSQTATQQPIVARLESRIEQPKPR